MVHLILGEVEEPETLYRVINQFLDTDCWTTEES